MGIDYPEQPELVHRGACEDRSHLQGLVANEFWSVTLYDAKDLFMVDNDIDRYSVSSNRQDELIYSEDGSVPICIQHSRPEQNDCNWLPAPEDDFYLHMRLYEPTQAVLDNQYPLPQVIKQS